MGAAGSVAGRVLLQVVEYVEKRGFDGARLCLEVGVSIESLRAPDAFVSSTLAERLGLQAAALTGDVNIGLHLAQALGDPSGFDAGVLMMMASPTLQESLLRMERYQRYWGDGSSFALIPDAVGMLLRYDQPGALGDYQRHSDEAALAKVVLGMRVLTAGAVNALLVRFRHVAPADVSEHHALFDCPIEFAARHSEIAIAQAALATPLPHANETYRAIFQQQVERALARLPGDSGLAADVRTSAQAALASGDCSLAATARTLGISARTLQRRLQAEGTSFNELVDSLRRELATTFLDQQVSVQEIAWLLGYAEPSAFHHAFRRWTGMTPEQARAERSGPARNS
jgi:AraC-like DNA-binding protein